MKEDSLWKALAEKYLKDFEIAQALKLDNKKEYVNLIKLRLFDDLWKRMQEFGETKPPFIEAYNSKFLRYDRKITIIETDSIDYAKLEVNEEGFRLWVNKAKNETQKRTLIAHEIGHTLLYDVDSLPIKPLFTRNRTADFFEHNRSAIFSKEEAFVYEIGRHILVPSNVLEKILSKLPSLDSFLESCNKGIFHISRDLMAKRLYWDVHFWENGLNYWPKSVLIEYPIAKAFNKNFPPPFGNNEIFTGKDPNYKNIDVKTKIWPYIIPMIELAISTPNRTIYSYNLEHLSGFKKIAFKEIMLHAEVRYVSNDKRVYILIHPGKYENQNLSDFLDID